MTAARKPPLWLALLGALLVLAGIPVDGLPGAGLSLLGVALSVRYLVLNRRYTGGGPR